MNGTSWATIVYLFYFMSDLAGQGLNAHAQTPCGRPTVTGKGGHRRIVAVQCGGSSSTEGLRRMQICIVERASYWVTFDLIHFEL